jgi:predicted HicB family RNase H-like nuclease
MTNILKYKKYVATVELDPDAGILHGEIINLNDVVTFQGRSVEELRQAFKDSVEDYLAACAEFGREPEKPFSGQFIVRVRPEVHRSAVIAARSAGKSLNGWIADTLEHAACEEGNCID